MQLYGVWKKVAEIKRAVFRALTRLRAATIKDGGASKCVGITRRLKKDGENMESIWKN